jgi:lipopolysaccharide transport system ATP-binding protein
VSDSIITVENLSKKYRLRHQSTERYSTLRDTLAAKAKSLFRRNGTPSPPRPGRGQGEVSKSDIPAPASQEDFWALKDVSFEVKQGEVVGIIGRNGAGKSTLLKILSRITEPTEGRVTLRGRVASLLEVGTGFHPELTGRENIFLNGAILGMSRAEIRKKFDEIVAFAEVEKFLDTPVKRYSSGMYVRLAFAVAAHLEPEILIVDEVLAVGDAQFQKKCLGRMSEVARGGRTVLFVSHNMVALQNLCGSALWLASGELVAAGSPAELVHRYLRSNAGICGERVWEDLQASPGTAEFRLVRAAVRSSNGGDILTVATPLTVEFDYWNLKPGAHLNLSIHVFDENGALAFNTIPYTDEIWHGKPFPSGLFRSMFSIPGHFLNDGRHSLKLMAVHDQGHINFILDDVLVFDVVDDQPREGWQGKWQGAVRPRLQWATELLSSRE